MSKGHCTQVLIVYNRPVFRIHRDFFNSRFILRTFSCSLMNRKSNFPLYNCNWYVHTTVELRDPRCSKLVWKLHWWVLSLRFDLGLKDFKLLTIYDRNLICNFLVCTCLWHEAIEKLHVTMKMSFDYKCRVRSSQCIIREIKEFLLNILDSFFVQPLFCALNFCIGIFHGKFDLFIQIPAVAMAAAAAE